MNKRLLAIGGTITACRKVSISKRYEAFKQNREERKFEKKLAAFTKEDLVAWRIKKGWTQPDFAEWCGRSLRAVQLFESGDNPIPKWLVRLIFFEDSQ